MAIWILLLQDMMDILEFYLTESRLVIFHNAPFDIAVFKKYIKVDVKLFDTQTAWHLLNENHEHTGLKYLTRKFLNREVIEYDDAIKFGINSNEFYEYAVADAVNTYDLYRIFAPQLEEEGLHHLAYDIEFPFPVCVSGVMD